jgi:hypothetical protein
MKYKVGEIEFDSKEQARKCIGKWLKEVCPVVQISDGSGFAFLKDLISRHPEADKKIGCGIIRFEIRENPIFTCQNSFYLIRKDGTETDFSFRSCLSGKKNSKYSDFCRAARHAISEQIVVFKTAQFIGIDNPQCEITGVDLQFNDCHVDHVVTFELLVKQFIRENSIDVESSVLDESFDGEIFPRFADDSVRKKWIEFHRQRAVLRLTTPEANLARRHVNE